VESTESESDFFPSSRERPRVARRVGPTTAAAGLAVVLAAACTAPSPEPAGPARVRLLERIESAEVELGAQDVPEEPFEESFLPCASGRRRCGLVAARLVPSEGHSDTRAALPAPGRTRFRFHVDAPRDALLRVGLGALAPEPAEGGEVRFVVRAARPGSAALRELATRTVAWSERATWLELEVELGDLSAGPVDLELESEARGGAMGAWAVPELVEARRAEPGANVLLLSLDTLRADHLSGYGYRRPTSPNLDAFARRGYRFATAISQAPWTRPSHRSMLTGINPSSHGDLRAQKLSEVFWRQGFRTFALTGGGQLDPKFGFGEGFEAYQGQEWLREPEQLFRRLDARPESRFFLFLHSWEPHDPYEDTRFAEGLPSGRVEGRFDHSLWLAWHQELTDDEKVYVEAMYDGDIARTDEGIRDLLAGLEARGLLDETIVAITSDHGEAFWEHGTWRHGMHLYDHQVHVPLILWVPPAVRARLGLVDPGADGLVVTDQVGLIDLYPTLAELAGVPVDHDIQGRSLVPFLRGEKMPPREVLSENVNVSKLERKSLRTDRAKLIQTIARDPDRDYGPELLLFDLRRDPGEHENLEPRMPEAAQALLARIAAIRAGSADTLEEAVPADLDPELRKQLQALGYIGN